MINEFSGQYRFLSNFWSCYVSYDGVWYPSVENAYQAAKMLKIEDRLKFEHVKASEAKRLGRLLPMKDDWDDERVDVMYQLVKQKFSQYKELETRLALTDDQQLEEGNWWGDTFWGTVNGKGDNNLGKVLMRVRSEIVK